MPLSPAEFEKRRRVITHDLAGNKMAIEGFAQIIAKLHDETFPKPAGAAKASPSVIAHSNRIQGNLKQMQTWMKRIESLRKSLIPGPPETDRNELVRQLHRFDREHDSVMPETALARIKLITEFEKKRIENQGASSNRLAEMSEQEFMDAIEEFQNHAEKLSRHAAAIRDELANMPESVQRIYARRLRETFPRHDPSQILKKLANQGIHLELAVHELHSTLKASIPGGATTFDLRDILKTIPAQHPQIDGKRIRIEFNLPNKPLMIHGEHNLLRILFRNLIKNAIDHRDPHRDLVLRVSAGHDGEYIHAKVSDSGKGIPANALPFIFQEFYSGRADHDRLHDSHGKGLSIVRDAASEHGGHVDAESTIGQGTTFSVRLFKNLQEKP